MKKFKVKLKMLCYGFPPVTGDCEIDGFRLKRTVIDGEQIEKQMEKEEFSTSGYIINCSFQFKDEKMLYYNYFESNDYFDYMSDTELNTKAEVGHYFLNNADIHNKVNNFKKKLRLIFNMRIVFPVYKIYVFNENREKINCVTCYMGVPGSLGIDEFDEDLFEHNSRFGFDLKAFIKTEKSNAVFSRAVSFFSQSFEPDKIALRYIMLISAAETLLVKEDKCVKEKLARRLSKILMYCNKEKEEFVYSRIRELYKIRSDYVHGNECIITDELVKELRGYVREALIIYWLISLEKKLSDIEIIKKIDSDCYFGLNSIAMAKYLRNKDTKATYREMCELIAEKIDSGDVVIKKEKNGVIYEVMEL